MSDAEEANCYSYYEKLIGMNPDELTEKIPEYVALASQYPRISKSIVLQKQAEGLRKELKLTKDRARRREIGRKLAKLDAEFKHNEIFKTLHGETKYESEFRRRHAVASTKKAVAEWLSSTLKSIQRIYSRIQERLREQSRRARLARVLKLPPSLIDLRSLDPADKSFALSEWIEKRKVGIQ